MDFPSFELPKIEIPGIDLGALEIGAMEELVNELAKYDGGFSFSLILKPIFDIISFLFSIDFSVFSGP